MMDKIKLSFWNYLPLDNYKKDVILDWKELGVNLAMSFVFDIEKHSKKAMNDFLDDCLEHNLKVIIVDTRSSFYELDRISEEEYRQNIKQAYEDFGHHKATFGFFIGDEPNFEHVDKAIRAAQIVQEEMPNLTPFLNLLPYFSNKKEQEKLGRNEEFFVNLLTKILKESKLPIIGFDHYTQCYDEQMDQEKGIMFYLYDLKMYQKVCEQCGVDFYVSNLSVGHWYYRVPTQDDFRWQINVSLAMGAKGILWFYFHQKSSDASYRCAPFYGENLTKNSTFLNLKIEQQHFISHYLEFFEDAKLLESNVIKKCKKYIDEDIKIECDRKNFLILSKFSKNNEIFYVLVNGSQKVANKYIVNITNNKKEEFYLAPGEMRVISAFKSRL